jgi:hypothetical protein
VLIWADLGTDQKSKDIFHRTKKIQHIFSELEYFLQTLFTTLFKFQLLLFQQLVSKTLIKKHFEHFQEKLSENLTTMYFLKYKKVHFLNQAYLKVNFPNKYAVQPLHFSYREMEKRGRK